jgi:signal transduction histidine kinase
VDEELLRLELVDQEGVFTVRSAGREAAAAAGLDTQDQIRVATALSEIGRDLVGYATPVTARFLFRSLPRPTLVIEFALRPIPGRPLPADGVTAASRLVDAVDEEAGEAGAVVAVCKNLPIAAPASDSAVLPGIRARLAELLPTSALEELRVRNADLIQMLADLRRQGEELRRLNAELEETSRGVMALYNELSEELEETNRGVVALYAELDDKSAQLREAAESKNRFWANISHELRTPVNSVIGLTRLLLHSGADPLTGEQRHQIELIAESGQTLLSLVNELLDIAKAERGALVPHLADLDVAVVLDQLAAQLAPLAAAAGIALVVAPPPVPVTLTTDEVMFTRILRNLLGNAIKFTSEGAVTVRCRLDGDDLIVTVMDTGVGIAPEHQQRVFEEFFQVPGIQGGTGLGLPYARRLANVLGGGLELTSVLGEGTTVTLRVPVSGPPVHPLLVTEPLPEADTPAVGHVLIVDDEDQARRTLRDLLGGSAARVSEAPDGVSALARAEADPPDLVLLDLRMPHGDGFHVLQGLAPGIPVVMVTAAIEALRDTRLARAGAVVDKGRLDRGLLMRAVHQAIEGTGGRDVR